jgi:hypothetical protein
MKSEIGKLIVLAIPFISLAAHAAGPQIKVIEYDKRGTPLNTFVMKSQPLVKEVSGKKALNVNPSNDQERNVYKLLNANFDFGFVCNYKEFSAFKKKYPDKEHWEVEELFSQYIIDNNIVLKKNGECFAENLERLLKAHPCLSKKASIEFHTKPVGMALQHYNHENDDLRRIVGVTLVNCPYDNDEQMLKACTFTRPLDTAHGFMGPPVWAELVDNCIAEFQKPEIKRLADAQLATAHTR